MFRYKVPEIRSGKKIWVDRYEKLAPAERYTSVRAVENDNLLDKFRSNLDSSKFTASTMQSVVDFVENVYFPFVKKPGGGLRDSTVVGYDNLWTRHIKPRLNGERMGDIKFRAAQKFLDDLAAARVSQGKPLSASSLGHIKWFMVSVFDRAKKDGAYAEEWANPFRECDVPKGVPKQATRHATLDQVLDMIAVLPDTAATVVAVAAFAGLRKSEIQGLKWEDLDGDELRISRAAWRTTKVEDTKTLASAASVPVIPALAKHLQAHRNGFPAEGFIFRGPKMGRPLDLHNLAQRVIRDALKEAKPPIPWPGWHGFRRGLSTNLKTLGVDDTVIQRVLRHANVEVTRQSYIKVEDTVKDAAMKKLQRALASKMKERKAKEHR
jgi:integrase